jgi:hypothetical protein
MSGRLNGRAFPFFSRSGPRLWVFVCVVSLLFLGAGLAMIGGGTHLTRFRIRNATGMEIAVTSAHTHKTVRVSGQKAALVPHTRGDITVTLPNGKTWVYKNLSPLDLKGTAFILKREYLFFGYEDGYIVRGSSTVDLLLNKDGRLYAIPPGVEDADVQKLEEPKGFPRTPVGG